MTKYIVAHDLGTSGNKATLFSADGRLIKSAQHGYGVSYGSGNRAEQDPEDWWRAFCETNRALLDGIDASQVEAVSFSGQMQGCVLVNKACEPLRKAIIWADMRAVREEEALRAQIDETDFYHLTGHRPSCAYSIEKLMWIKAQEPALYRQAYKMLCAKDYLVARLSGSFVTDYSDASGTNAFDINTFRWSEPILAAAGIDGALLPEALPSTTVVGEISAAMAAVCGLPKGVKIVLGGGDGMCASVGAGSVRPGVAYNCLGSSAWISLTTEKPIFDPDRITFNWAHIVPGLIGPCGTMQAAGISYDRMASLFYADEFAARSERSEVFALIDNEIAASPVMANGLLYLPYLLGERSPRWNPLARGVFAGLKAEHTRGDILRSVVEGVAMNQRLILNAFRRAVDIRELRVLGGLAQSRVVRDILADVYQADIHKVKQVKEATSIGAAVTAGVGCGLLPGFDAVSAFVQIDAVSHPDARHTPAYEKGLALFDEAYAAMLPVYAGLATF